MSNNEDNLLFRLKTKKELLDSGWKENKRSIYNRLTIDGERSKEYSRAGDMRTGSLSEYHVDHFLGTVCKIVKIDAYNEIPLIVLEKTSKFDNRHLDRVKVPYSAVHGLTKAKLKKVSKQLRTILLKNKFSNYDIKINQINRRIHVGCKSISFDDMSDIISELNKHGIY